MLKLMATKEIYNYDDHILQVMQRLQQYKDDLLAACLTFILSLPREVIISQIITIVPAIKVNINYLIRSCKYYLTLVSIN